MKKYLLLLFLGFALSAKAQDKIIFDYDAAGNQINRELCIKCTKAGYKTTSPKEVVTLKEEDLQKFFPEDVISYYPNPVKEELFLKWELTQGKTVNTIYVYDINGRAIRTFNGIEKTDALNIPFFDYPAGTYLIVLGYNDGEQKTIKIVK